MGTQTCLIGQTNLFGAGLKLLLRRTPYEVAREARSVREIVDLPTGESLFLLCKPDDVREIEPDIAYLRSAVSVCRVVLLAKSIELDQLALSFAAGADAYLLEEISPEALLESLHLVMLGEKVFPSRLAVLMCADCWGLSHPAPSLSTEIDLSDREREILQWLTDGLPNKLIANKLAITEATVKVHIKTILKKLGAQNRTQAAIWAIQHGLSVAPGILGIQTMAGGSLEPAA